MVASTGTSGAILSGGVEGSVGVRFLTAMAMLAALLALLMPAAAIDPLSTLECHRRQYTYKVHKTDDNGRMCWDYINVMSCWGRCDSNEIADWKFPYKRSHHPVCMHEETHLTQVTLRNCHEDVAPGTEIYTFHEANRCSCSVCKSSEASCEGLRYRGARRAPRVDVPRG
ncbi:thyrostimulin beta-5 subunit [Penaeus vannamei]|nr:thyrostimulin beta-5 subunit-like [Penaeus vannamei]